jgi:hypothetical protein
VAVEAVALAEAGVAVGRADGVAAAVGPVAAGANPIRLVRVRAPATASAPVTTATVFRMAGSYDGRRDSACCGVPLYLKITGRAGFVDDIDVTATATTESADYADYADFKRQQRQRINRKDRQEREGRKERMS